MTKEDIIKLALNAGFLIDTHAQQYQPNCILSTYGLIDENLQRFATLVAAAEREACAKVCDELSDVNYVEKRLIAYHHAYLIRQRGQHERKN